MDAYKNSIIFFYSTCNVDGFTKTIVCIASHCTQCPKALIKIRLTILTEYDLGIKHVLSQHTNKSLKQYEYR